MKGVGVWGEGGTNLKSDSQAAVRASSFLTLFNILPSLIFSALSIFVPFILSKPLLSLLSMLTAQDRVGEDRIGWDRTEDGGRVEIKVWIG